MSVEYTLNYAKGVKEEDHLSKNDLYAVITYGGQKVTSKQASDGALPLGYRYKWEQTFSFQLTTDNDIEVKLYDKDVGKDDFVGEARVSLQKARAHGTSEETSDVIIHGKKHGQVHGKVVVIP